VIATRADPALPLARLRARRELVEIRAANVAAKRVSEFNMNFSLKRAQAPSDKGAGAPAKDVPKGPAPAAKKG